MNKKEILDYVMQTPHNTNRSVLSSLLDQLSSDSSDDFKADMTVNISYYNGSPAYYYLTKEEQDNMKKILLKDGELISSYMKTFIAIVNSQRMYIDGYGDYTSSGGHIYGYNTDPRLKEPLLVVDYGEPFRVRSKEMYFYEFKFLGNIGLPETIAIAVYRRTIDSDGKIVALSSADREAADNAAYENAGISLNINM